MGSASLPLSRPEMKSTFHHTLISLALVDIIFVITLIIDTQRFDLNLNNQLFIFFFPYVWNPFKNILMTFETFLMMSITTERYLAIRRPLEYRLGRVRYSSTMHLAIYILPALLLSVVLNIPKFFETELVTIERTDARNVTVLLIDYNITDLRLHPDYILYYTHWTRLLATGLLPFLYLLLVNGQIARRLRYQGHFPAVGRRRCQEPAIELRRHHSRADATAAQGKASSSAGLLVAIVIVYLVCNIPR